MISWSSEYNQIQPALRVQSQNAVRTGAVQLVHDQPPVVSHVSRTVRKRSCGSTHRGEKRRTATKHPEVALIPACNSGVSTGPFCCFFFSRMDEPSRVARVQHFRHWNLDERHDGNMPPWHNATSSADPSDFFPWLFVANHLFRSLLLAIVNWQTRKNMLFIKVLTALNCGR